jgi:hypothetical protein
LCLEGALRDRDRDGYADSFKLDVVTGRVQVAMATQGSYDPLISTEYCFELKSKIDVLSGYRVKSTYGVSGKRRVGEGSAFRQPTQSIVKQPDYVFPVGKDFAILNSFIQSRSGGISGVYCDWVNCMQRANAVGSSVSREIAALDCAFLLA